MKIKKAVGLGAILWVLIFFEVSILKFGLQLQPGDYSYYTIHFILSSIFVIVLSVLYFKGKQEKSSKVKKSKAKKSSGIHFGNLYEGVLLGICFIIVGVILDSIITVPLFVKTYNFFADTALLMGYALTLILCAIVGWVSGLVRK
jgi:low temperature requirement protein LtrA